MPLNPCLAVTLPVTDRWSSHTTRISFSTKLNALLRYAPFDSHQAIRDLSQWLLCFKNLLPVSAPPHHETHSPFSLNTESQTLRIEADSVRNTIHAILDGENAIFLTKKLLEYVALSDWRDWRDWQASIRADDPDTAIDLADKPGNWPQQTLAWAIRTMDMQGADLAGAVLNDMDLCGVVLDNVNLQGADLRRSNLRDARLTRCNLRGAELDHIDLVDTRIFSCDFSNAKLRAANLAAAELIDCNFDSADMLSCNLTCADVSGCNMRNTMLTGAKMNMSDLRGSKFLNADLSYANLAQADLRGAALSARDGNLTGANFCDSRRDAAVLDFAANEIAPDGWFTLRKGLFPRTLDHDVRENLLQAPYTESDRESDYQEIFTDSDSDQGLRCDRNIPANRTSATQTLNQGKSATSPPWKTVTLLLLSIFSAQLFDILFRPKPAN